MGDLGWLPVDLIEPEGDLRSLPYDLTEPFGDLVGVFVDGRLAIISSSSLSSVSGNLRTLPGDRNRSKFKGVGFLGLVWEHGARSV